MTLPSILLSKIFMAEGSFLKWQRLRKAQAIPWVEQTISGLPHDSTPQCTAPASFRKTGLVILFPEKCNFIFNPLLHIQQGWGLDLNLPFHLIPLPR